MEKYAADKDSATLYTFASLVESTLRQSALSNARKLPPSTQEMSTIRVKT